MNNNPTNKVNGYDDEEMTGGNSPQSSLLRNETKQDYLDSGIPFCGCLSLKFYQPYFDLDSQEVIDRIWMSTLFCRRAETFLDYISSETKTADAYGPFWVRKHSYSTDIRVVI